jgi:hypothetical protein
MKNLHIYDSYNTWSRKDMKEVIRDYAYYMYDSFEPEKLLNRSYKSMYIEWWLHNIGYYITKPLCFIDLFFFINARCEDVDLQEWK